MHALSPGGAAESTVGVQLVLQFGGFSCYLQVSDVMFITVSVYFCL